MKINEFAKEVHKNAVEHGWWKEERSFGDIIALCHSELSEALEEYRNGKPRVYCNYNTCGDCKEENKTCINCYKDDIECGVKDMVKPEGIAIELADCIIRILDYCGHENIDIENALKIKHEYNKTRLYRHGNKIL